MIAHLAHHLFESTVFCLALGAIACCLRGHRAAARHAAWLIGVSKFALPTALLAATGAQIAFLLPASSWVSSLAFKLYAVLAGVLDSLPAKLIPRDTPAVTTGLVAVWALGAGMMLWRWADRLQANYPELKRPAGEEQKALDRARRRLELRHPVALTLSGRTSEPGLLGIFHSTVTIPEGLSERLTPAEFEAVLLHELAHAARRDNLVGALVHCLVCVFWFHPLLWLAESRLAAERERACDELVIAAGAERQTYVAGVLKVCRFHLIEPLAGVSGIGSADLKTRLDLILSCPPRHSLPRGLRVLLAGLVMAMMAVPIAGGYCAQCVSNGQDAVSHGRGPRVQTRRFVKGT